MNQVETTTNASILLRAWQLMTTAKAMTELYEANFKFVSKYVHATSRGHEAIQIATGLQLTPGDYLYPYYRDDALMLSIGMTPYDLMLQLMAKRDDPFSGGRTYYCHPSLKDDDKPFVPHQSSATGMQAIPATGAALGIRYKEKMAIPHNHPDQPVPLVVCSLGDASMTEGEVAEALQMAALKQLPIIYLVQDNGWDISANAEETRAQDAAEYARGFHGIEVRRVDGSDFQACWSALSEVISLVRSERRPFLIHASVPLLNHHTSGVRKEWYRDDLEAHQVRDPWPRLRQFLLDQDATEDALINIERSIAALVKDDFDRAAKAEDPRPEDLFSHDYAPTHITSETGNRKPPESQPIVMVDCALHAVKEQRNRKSEAHRIAAYCDG